MSASARNQCEIQISGTGRDDRIVEVKVFALYFQIVHSFPF